MINKKNIYWFIFNQGFLCLSFFFNFVIYVLSLNIQSRYCVDANICEGGWLKMIRFGEKPFGENFLLELILFFNVL